MTEPPQKPDHLHPEWLAHRYDPGYDAVHFVQANRAARRSAAFLTDENLTGSGSPVVVRREESLAMAPPPAPVHFIFHSAYCCSTLVANALDREGMASSLKEPTLLNDLVGWRHRGAPPAQLAQAMDSGLRLLSRPLAAGEAVIVKPSNVVNALAPAMLAMRPDARCLLLYAPLNIYLGSIAAKGLWGRLWVRDLLAKQLKDQMVVDLGFTPEDHFLQTDLQVAAIGWLAQHRLFARLAELWPERVRTLDSESLLAAPAQALTRLHELFSLRTAASDVEEVVSNVFTRHAKFGSAFTNSDRVAAQEAAAKVHSDELEKVLVWAAEVAAGAGIQLELPGSLMRP